MEAGAVAEASEFGGFRVNFLLEFRLSVAGCATVRQPQFLVSTRQLFANRLLGDALLGASVADVSE